MWEKLIDALKNALTISVKVEKQEKEIDELKAEVKRLSAAVQLLIAELKSVSDLRQNDREFIEVYIEKELLKFERRLPSGKQLKSDEE